MNEKPQGRLETAEAICLTFTVMFQLTGVGMLDYARRAGNSTLPNREVWDERPHAGREER